MRIVTPMLLACLICGMTVVLLDTQFSPGADRREEKRVPEKPGDAQADRKKPAVKEYVNSKDKSTLVWIPGGEFILGSDKGDPDERPPHKIVIKGFWLGKLEVTNAQYAAFLKATDEAEPMHWKAVGYNDPRQPVVGVTWEEAQAYADWAGLRLPTEAEWEYAAKGGRQLGYATATGELSHDLANYQGTGGKDRWNGPAPVGSFPPNPYGLHDMAGNVWEWTSSFYKPYPYSREDGRENTDEADGLRVMRGGAWHFAPPYLTTSFRRRFESHLEYDYVGFRVALSSVPAGSDSGGKKN